MSEEEGSKPITAWQTFKQDLKAAPSELRVGLYVTCAVAVAYCILLVVIAFD